MLPLSPSSYNNCRPEHIQRCFLWKRLSHQFFPTRATGSALYVMGGPLRFLGHVRYSYTCTGSALDVMDYGLAKAIGISSRPTGRMLFELRIIVSGLKLRRLFHRSASSIRSVLFSMEKTLSLISPYTCHGLHALRYGWSAAVPWSRLFLLHVHGLRARRHGLWAS